MNGNPHFYQKFVITDGVLEYLGKRADKAAFPGVSRIRKGEDRLDNLYSDALVGHLGLWALSMYLCGSSYYYMLSRHIQDQDPRKGDGGTDIPGALVDVKGSLKRNPTKSIPSYNLCVRPEERHPNTTYVMALYVPEISTVYLTGWAANDEFPLQVVQDGPLRGTYAIPVAQLHPMMPLHWWKATP